MFLCICNRISKLGFEDIKKIDYKAFFRFIEEGLSDPYPFWNNFFNYLLNLNRHISLHECACFSFVNNFLNYYKELVENKTKIIGEDLKNILVEIEKTKLGSPNNDYFSSSIEGLYEIDKQECFKFGWQVLNYIFVMKGKKVSWYIMYDYIFYTFLSKINSNNYKFFWDKYFNYLRELFKIQEL
ncbi:MAG: hypothetical protein ACFFDK_15380 [Promethearchaeota archaeon]